VTAGWKNYILRSFIILTLHKIILEWLIKEDEIGTCSMHEETRKIDNILVSKP
jgi:hypothetical protein